MANITELQPGDYVQDLQGTMHKIASIWGVSPTGKLAKPSEGGFGCITEAGIRIGMMSAKSYHKAEHIEPLRLSSTITIEGMGKPFQLKFN